VIPELHKPIECVILAYHRVNGHRRDPLTVRTTAFREQLALLLGSGYRNVGLEELAALVSGTPAGREKVFAITFDDGYRDGFTDALPVLKELGCRATFFLVADQIGAERPFPWDLGRFASLTRDDFAMDDREVGELLDAGMSIGSHTCSHPLLATVDQARARDEIERSKRVLEGRFGVPVRTFCYPAGSLSDGVVAMVAEAGYFAGVVTPPVPGIPETIFTLKRVGIYQATTSARLRLRLHPVLAQARDVLWSLRWRLGRRARTSPQGISPGGAP